jgi:hypothetical protein
MDCTIKLIVALIRKDLQPFMESEDNFTCRHEKDESYFLKIIIV